MEERRPWNVPLNLELDMITSFPMLEMFQYPKKAYFFIKRLGRRRSSSSRNNNREKLKIKEIEDAQ
jgi:hypothetical protein